MATMSRLVCVKCQRRYRRMKCGINVVETFGENSDEPYKLWKADLWRCPGCGTEIVTGFGFENFAEHYQPNFKEVLARSEPKYWDKSCG